VTTLTGKMKLFCPSLFSSLSLWERDTLESSRWLLSTTSTTKIGTDESLGFKDPVKESSKKHSRVILPPLVTNSPFTGSTDIPASLHFGMVASPTPQCLSLRELGIICSSTSPIQIDSVMEPGFREVEEGESSLNTSLNSLIPFIKDNKDTTNLPTFQGKAPIDLYTPSEATSSNPQLTRDGKDYAWSKGLGIELSPLKN